MHTKITYLESQQKPAVVYWIHYPTHTNCMTEGYIGVSTDLAKRLQKHKSSSSWMFNRLMKGAVVDILHTFDTLSEACEKERWYRPEANIGWNMNPGGGLPPSQYGRTYEKQKLTGNERTLKQKKASMEHSVRMRQSIPHNKGVCTPIQVDGVIYQSAYDARDQTGYSLSKVYRIGLKIK